MQATQCPPQNRLKDYLAGKLDDEDSDVLGHHLSQCTECEQQAAKFECEPDSLVELLQIAPPTSRLEETAGLSIGPDAPKALASIPSIIASYELLKQLGGGGMGAVYLARHRKLDKQVAIKLLPAMPARMPEFVARFEREMRAAGQLEHPAIVRSTDAGEENGIHFLVMDAIDGLDLSRIARAQAPLSVADACEMIRQAALGLSHAHEKGIVHRDIKPSNLMLDANGQVKILDFGLAQVGLWEGGSAEITTVGQLMGTLDYMAPEQAERGGAVDYRADIYSLGASLFRLLTGRPPLAAAPDLTPLEKLRLLSTHKPPKLMTLRDDVPVGLSELLESFLARDPSSRPASAAHAAESLAAYCQPCELQPLLARAQAASKNEEPSHPPLPLLLPQGLAIQSAPAHATSVLAGHQQAGSRWRDGVMWAAIALSFAMLLGGLVFVLETSKGQLVIDSADANVHVKLLKDGLEVDALQIQPGTKTTRLRGGKYEIVIDAPSNHFTISNQQFTIRNGETIVAKISERTHTASEPGRPLTRELVNDYLGNNQSQELLNRLQDTRSDIEQKLEQLRNKHMQWRDLHPEMIWTEDGQNPYIAILQELDSRRLTLSLRSEALKSTLKQVEISSRAGTSADAILVLLFKTAHDLKAFANENFEGASSTKKLGIIVDAMQVEIDLLASEIARLDQRNTGVRDDIAQWHNNYAAYQAMLTEMRQLEAQREACTQKIHDMELISAAAGTSENQAETRLTEIVYDGETLDVWLQRLKYERNANVHFAALNALTELANPSNADLIEPVLIEFLSDTITTGDFTGEAVNVLASISGARLFDHLALILQRTPDSSHARIINLIAFHLRDRDVPNADDLTTFLAVAASVLVDPTSTPGVQQLLAKLLKDMLIASPDKQFSRDCQEAVLKVLVQSKQLTDRNFWLATVDGYSYGTQQAELPWYDSLGHEVLKRALAVLSDEAAGADLAIRAGLVINSMASNDFKLLVEEKSRLVAGLSKRLELASQQPEEIAEIVDLPPELAFGAKHVLPNTIVDLQTVPSKRTIHSIVLLNSIAAFQLQAELQDELQALHDSLDASALYGSEYVRIEDDEASWKTLLHLGEIGSSTQLQLRQVRVRKLLLRQIAYVQSGRLLGLDLAGLCKRFQDLQNSDIAAYLQTLSDRLTSLSALKQESPKEYRAELSRIVDASKLITARHAEVVIPKLVEILKQQDAALDPNWANALLVQVAGDQYFVHLAHVLDEVSPEQCVALLDARVRVQGNMLCQDPNSLAELLAWSDRIFAVSPEALTLPLDEISILQTRIANFLLYLLHDSLVAVGGQDDPPQDEMDAGVVSEACQREIVAHLQRYSQLTDKNFWLSESVMPAIIRYRYKSRFDGSYCEAFRRVVLDRSITLLTHPAKTDEQKQLQVHAMLILHSLIQAGDELIPAQEAANSNFLAKLFSDSARDLESQISVVPKVGSFNQLREPFLPSLHEKCQTYLDLNNPLLAGLYLAEDLQLEPGSALVAALQRLHDVAGEPQILTNYFDNQRHDLPDASDPQKVREREDNLSEFLVQAVFLKTGVLLGKEFTVLAGRPERLNQEALAERLRLVQAGDTLAIYVPAVLPGSLPGDVPQTPVMQAGTNAPVIGIPVPVNSQGEIRVPLLSALTVQGKSLRQIREMLIEQYSDGILQEADADQTSVQFLLRANEKLEVRNITTPTSTPPKP